MCQDGINGRYHSSKCHKIYVLILQLQVMENGKDDDEQEQVQVLSECLCVKYLSYMFNLIVQVLS